MVHNIIGTLLLLDAIAYVFFLIRYIKKETMKSAIGCAITSAVICALEIILFIIADSYSEYAQSVVNFAIYTMNLRLAICEIRRCKNQ